MTANIAKAALEHAGKNGNNVIILDTAGRLHIDEEMMEELQEIKNTVEVHQSILVVDAMTGQDAVNVAENFNEKIGIDGVIVTKLDGDTRGGAALSIKAVTGCPILYVGMGEKLSDLEQFYPDRMASRILGMGDVLSLIEKAGEEIDEEQARKMTEKLKKSQFDFEDYLESMKQMRKMGGLGSIMNMLPGLGGMGGLGKGKMPDIDADDAEQKMARVEAIIYSMTIKERQNPDIITPQRKRRIAAGAGGLLLGDIGLAFSGGVNGFSKDLAKVAGLEIGAGALLYFIGALNPFTLVAVLLTAIITSWNSSSSGAMKRTKEMVSEQIVNQLTANADENSSQMAKAICQKLDDIANSISTAIDVEIGQTEEQVQSIIAEMQRGQASIDARKQVINSCENKITALSTDLDAFTFELIEQK